MALPLKILVACGSWHIGVRIIHNLDSINGIDIVGQARNADETLEQVLSKKPDLIILDVLLSHGTGLDVLHTVKQIPAAPVVVMTSASLFAQYRTECLKGGADHFVHLPGEVDALNTIVRELVDSARIVDGQ